jgi:hypothetical protein
MSIRATAVLYLVPVGEGHASGSLYLVGRRRGKYTRECGAIIIDGTVADVWFWASGVVL